MKVSGSLLVDVIPTPSDSLQSHQIEPIICQYPFNCFQCPCSTEAPQIRISKSHVHFPKDLTKPKALFNMIFLVRSCYPLA